jgi:hypothetical protein
MGVYWKFANLTDKEIVDGYSAKSGEWRQNSFDQALIINYLFDNQFAKEVKFIADESGEWDMYNEETGFTDVTADVLWGMYENGYFNEDIGQSRIEWIYSKFREADRVGEFETMCKRYPKFEEVKKELILKELER